MIISTRRDILLNCERFETTQEIYLQLISTANTTSVAMHYDNVVVSDQRGEPLSIAGSHCVHPGLSDSSNG